MNNRMYTLFPTLVYSCVLDNHKEHYKRIMEVYDKHSFIPSRTLVQGEYAGKATMHQDPVLKPLYDDIIVEVKRYLKAYRLRETHFDYYITRSSLVIVDSSDIAHDHGMAAISPHYHPSSDVSFVYYLEAPNLCDALWIMNDQSEKIMDNILCFHRPIEDSLINEVNEYNTNRFPIEVTEGTLLVFLSETKHMVDRHPANVDGRFTGRRLSIAGDVNLVLKPELKAFEMGKVSLDKWEKF